MWEVSVIQEIADFEGYAFGGVYLKRELVL